MADYDIIIRNGIIIDGLRTPRYIGDLAVKDGVIRKIGGLRRSSANSELDASGLVVAPGFVDLHTHYDSQIQWDPYCTLSGWHGVTSVAIGNCGFGFAPCAANEKDQDRLMLMMTRNEAIPYDAMKQGMLWDWVSLPEFFNTIDRIPKGVNVVSLVPLTPIYAWVMGYDESKKRRPNEAELKEMCRLVNEGMDAGACGWSAQVDGPETMQRDYDGTPMVTDLLTDGELFAFAQVLRDRDEGSIELAYYEHPGLDLKPEVAKSLEKIAATANRPVVHQIVIPFDKNPEIHRQRLRWLEDCARRGIPLYGQGLTHNGTSEFTFEDWNLFDDSPTWRQVTLGSVPERKAKMQNEELRAAMRKEWDEGRLPGPTTIKDSVAGLIVEEVGRPDLAHYVDKSVGQIAQDEGKHVIDALLDIVVADNLKTEFIGIQGKENAQYTAELANSLRILPGVSDGGAHVKFMTQGSYPTQMLTWLVRDEGMVSLEEAHFKLGYFSAFLGGIRDRGFLREGAPADILVYDLEHLALGAVEIAHDLPGGDWRRIQKAEGYRWILVNGQITFENGEATGTLPGKLLRHGVG